jgi:hypothetical protein
LREREGERREALMRLLMCEWVVLFSPLLSLIYTLSLSLFFSGSTCTVSFLFLLVISLLKKLEKASFFLFFLSFSALQPNTISKLIKVCLTY